MDSRATPNTKPRSWGPIALAVAMHAILAAFLFVGINWKTKEESSKGNATVSAQIWVEPKVETKVETKTEPKPEPKEVIKPEPKIETKIAAPDIVSKKTEVAKKPEPKKDEPKKAEPKKDVVKKEEPKKEVPKKEEPKKKEDPKKDTTKKDDDEQRQKELDRLIKAASSSSGTPSPTSPTSASSPSNAGTSGGTSAGSGTAKVDASYGAKLRDLLRSNTMFAGADEMEGNPEVIFGVKLKPDCTIAQIRLHKTSGVTSWDNAAERAIKRTDPFPNLSDGTCPRDELMIRQKPKN